MHFILSNSKEKNLLIKMYTKIIRFCGTSYTFIRLRRIHDIWSADSWPTEFLSVILLPPPPPPPTPHPHLLQYS